MAFLLIVFLWALLLAISWPVALILLVLVPFLWLLSIPFRIVGIVLEGLLALIRGIVLLPSRILGLK